MPIQSSVSPRRGAVGRRAMPILVALGMAGCGDNSISSDGETGAADACSTSECRVPVDYGMMEDVAGIAIRAHPVNYSVWQTNIEDECGDKKGHLSVDLMAGRGALINGIQPGTYELEPEDLSMETCGICIRLNADAESTDPRCYLATAGTLMLVEVDDYLQGEFQDTTFGPVSCEDFSPIETDCSSRIGSLAFESAYYPSD